MADIFASLDIQPQTTQQPNVTSSSDNKTQNEPGFFDSFIAEYTVSEGATAGNLQQQSQPQEDSKLIAFNGGNLFAGSVMELLAEM
ncbi:MAG: hypothetical protein IJU31_02745, partial [Synergistaceae bacterium]|nr:hypothetical protein [Synergistaceae bacterium]